MPGEKFKRPIQFVQEEDRFRPNEVGITHPENEGYFRIKDNGDIEIMASSECGIIIHPARNTITLVADNIKFLTKEHGGLRWNGQLFNEMADTFNEPALVPASDDDSYGLYNGVEQFLYDDTDDEEQIVALAGDLPPEIAELLSKTSDKRTYPEVMVTDPETGGQISYRSYYVKYGKAPTFGVNGG